MLEGLVEDVYYIMKKQFVYKKNSKGKLVSTLSRLADPSHGAANRTFRKTEENKSKLPLDFWK
jgi:hypothetical protein